MGLHSRNEGLKAVERDKVAENAAEENVMGKTLLPDCLAFCKCPENVIQTKSPVSGPGGGPPSCNRRRYFGVRKFQTSPGVFLGSCHLSTY